MKYSNHDGDYPLRLCVDGHDLGYDFRVFVDGKWELSPPFGIYTCVARLITGVSLLRPPILISPPLPISVVKDEITNGFINEGIIYNGGKGGLYRNKAGQYEPQLPDSLLEVKSERGKHQTQKPVELMNWILKYYSKPGDVVFDCCMGSGSMGVACKGMDRNFIGIELNPEIYEVAVNRIED